MIDSGYIHIKAGNQILANVWGNDVLFSWRWWLILGLTVIPWGFVYVYMKREKRARYAISGLLAMIISSFLDVAGLSFDLWRYYVTLVPVMGGFFPWNFTVIPVGFILFYEWMPKWSPLLKSLIVAVGFAFIGEPVTDFLGLNAHHRWQHLYSVPIYALIYLVSYYGGQFLSKRVEHPMMEREQGVLAGVQDKYRYIFDNSFNAIYFIEKKHLEKDFRFTEVNDAFCEFMGYSREELKTLDPRKISDQECYNVDIKYRPLLTKGSMKLDTTFVTKSGDKKFVRLYVKVILRKNKIEILSIANFLEKEVVEEHVN